MRRFLPIVLSLPLLVSSVPPALAQAKGGADSPNVLVKVSLHRQAPDGSKSVRTIQAVARADGGPTQVIEGIRVPIPTRERDVAAYTYQNVGLTLNVEVRMESDRSVVLQGKVEESSLFGQASPPTVRTWTHEMNRLLLTEGKPLEVARLEDADGTKTTLSVEIDVP